MNGFLTPAVLGLATCLIVSGCAQGTTATHEDPDLRFDPGATLSGAVEVMGFGAVDEIATTRLARAEEALGDGVSVELAEGELDIQQFLSAVASGDPPDLIYADRTQIGTFASRGALMPLRDCIAGEGIDTGSFQDEAVDQVTFGEDMYGVPEFSTVQVIMANRDLLDDAGVELDEVNGSDWEALRRASTTIGRRSGSKVTVIGFDAKLPEFLPLWAKANGAEMISDDGREAQLDDPRVIEALEMAVGVYEDQGGFGGVKSLRDSADFFGDQNQFATGQLGAMPMEQWYVNVLNDVSPDAPLAFDTFRDRSGHPLAWSSGSAWAIPQGSANPLAACRFVKTMTETASWVAAGTVRAKKRMEEGGMFTGVLTGNTDADEEIQAMVRPSGDARWDAAVEAIYTANEHAFAMPANPAGDEFESAWQDAVNRVLNGQQDAPEAMRQAQEEAQQALDKAWDAWDE